MTYQVAISKQAKKDLQEIYEYIAFTLLSPQNAAGKLEQLEKEIMELNYMPMRFREYEAEPWHSRGLRIMPVDNFVVLYVPDKETAVVTVIRVMYSGRDIERQLSKS